MYIIMYFNLPGLKINHEFPHFNNFDIIFFFL